MRNKSSRVLAAGLAAVLAAGTPAAVRAADEKITPFSDISDPAVSEAAEFLRLMDVVEGVPGGNFQPDSTLTRAEFCKMAISVLERAGDEPAQRSRTIYFDVTSSHWARGYINLASTITLGGDTEGKGAVPLVSGIGDGTFQPDRPVTSGEAAAILCRILGYSVQMSAGGAWYDGYLSTAESVGLADGLTLSGNAPISRGEAALLFYNLYFCNPKDSKESYLVSKGGTEEDTGIILDTDAIADDGTPGSVETTKTTYKTDRTFSSDLQGREGKAILDADGKLLAFRLTNHTSQKTYNIRTAEADRILFVGGGELKVKLSTKVWQDGEETTWEKVYLDLPELSTVTAHYDSTGKLTYLFLHEEPEDGPEIMIARTTPNGIDNPFARMIENYGYTMYKNGILADASDIRQYDVAVLSEAAKVIQVSDLKLSGILEEISPSPSMATEVSMMGCKLKVLDAARKAFSSFRAGDKVTLLLTADNRVAGAVSAEAVKGTAVGLASVSGTSAEVTLIQGGLKISGTVSSGTAGRCNQQLVTVTNNSAGRLTLEKVTGSAVKGGLDTSARLLDGKTVAENVIVYDRVGEGTMAEIDYDDLPAEIPPEKIAFVSYDYAGRIRYLVLNEATGDSYVYGYLEAVGASSIDDDETQSINNKYDVWVRMGSSEGGETTSAHGIYDGNSPPRTGTVAGIALTSDGKVSAITYLDATSRVKKNDFNMDDMTVTIKGVVYPLAEDVQCYNEASGTWLKSGKDGVNQARAYTNSLVLYYDRAPADGGKIRLVVIP